MNNTQLEQIKQTEQLIIQAKANLKSWANQISQHYKQLKALSQQLATLKGEITMNENNINDKLKGGTN